MKSKLTKLLAIVILFVVCLCTVSAYAENVFAEEAVEGVIEESFEDVAYSEEISYAAASGWIQDEYGWWYRYEDGSYPSATWAYIGNAWYHFNAAGYMETGWLWDGAAWYYLDPWGTIHTGWLWDNGKWYYMDGSGQMYIGWLWDGSHWYYLGGDGAMKTGWFWNGTNWFYMNESGAMLTGWLWDGSHWYYLDESGRMCAGWYKVGGVWYYSNGSGEMQTGWQLIGGDWYYFTESGAMVTGSQTIDGKEYYFLDNGMLSVQIDQNQIKLLQQALINLGYLNAAADGNMNDRTVSAIKLFQATHGYNDLNGAVTTSLYDSVISETQPFTPIGPSSSYVDVVGLQKALREHNMVMWADGGFGEMTQYAVLQIQKMFGLPQTGVADAETMYQIFTYDSHVDNYHNVQGYYSNSQYLIFINATTNRMYVYWGGAGNWNLLYNWQCATGRAETPTVLGEFNTYSSGYYFGDASYTCYYYTGFFGAYLIHSTIYNGYTWDDQDSRLGMNLSHGCVRLKAENAQWIYNNIPYGTKVVVVQ